MLFTKLNTVDLRGQFRHCVQQETDSLQKRREGMETCPGCRRVDCHQRRGRCARWLPHWQRGARARRPAQRFHSAGHRRRSVRRWARPAERCSMAWCCPSAPAALPAAAAASARPEPARPRSARGWHQLSIPWLFAVAGTAWLFPCWMELVLRHHK